VESYVSGHHIFVDDDMCEELEEEALSNNVGDDGMCDISVVDFDFLSDCGVCDDD
jgi:hypothetical protein